MQEAQERRRLRFTQSWIHTPDRSPPLVSLAKHPSAGNCQLMTTGE
jgi:hypothetical protein